VDPKKSANYLANKKEYQDLSIEEFVQKVKSEDSKLTDETQITDFAKIAIEKNIKAVEDYKKGSAGSLEFLVGMVMRESKGKADATVARKILTDLLQS